MVYFFLRYIYVSLLLYLRFVINRDSRPWNDSHYCNHPSTKCPRVPGLIPLLLPLNLFRFDSFVLYLSVINSPTSDKFLVSMFHSYLNTKGSYPWFRPILLLFEPPLYVRFILVYRCYYVLGFKTSRDLIYLTKYFKRSHSVTPWTFWGVSSNGGLFWGERLYEGLETLDLRSTRDYSQVLTIGFLWEGTPIIKVSVYGKERPRKFHWTNEIKKIYHLVTGRRELGSLCWIQVEGMDGPSLW